MKAHPKKLGLLTAAMLAIAAVPSAAFAAPKGRVMRDRPKKKMPKTTLALAERWGAIFNVPVSWIMSIADVESDFDVEMSDDRERAMKRDGAWGLMGMTLKTAESEIARLRKHPDFRKNPYVRRALSYWDGTGQSLWNPDLNVMLGSFYLRLMRKRFGDKFDVAATAYQQGPRSPLVDRLMRGLPIPSRTWHEKGQDYRLSAIKAHGRYL